MKFGFILKSKSPSCGLERVKKYNLEGNPLPYTGKGLFALEFLKLFPQIPVIDDGRLHDAKLKENFIQSIFVINHWKIFSDNDPGMSGLFAFHKNHKTLLMTHSLYKTKLLEHIISHDNLPFSRKMSLYERILCHTLKIQSTRQRITNVLRYYLLYLKKNLSINDQNELRMLIAGYYKGYIPLIAPITLIKHHARMDDKDYLKHQVFLNPYPDELKLRNSI